MPDQTNEESVGSFYDAAIFEEEPVRLTRDCPVERAITLRWLERLAPANAEVAEIGVGGGIDSQFLARKGWRALWMCRYGFILRGHRAPIRWAGDE